MHKELAGETTHEVAERGHQATDQYVNPFQPIFDPDVTLTLAQIWQLSHPIRSQS